MVKQHNHIILTYILYFFLSNVLVLESSRILLRDYRDFMQQLIETDAESHIETLCGVQGKLLWWEGRIRGTRKLSDTMGTKPPKSIKVGLWGFAEVREPLVFWSRFPAYMYGWELKVLVITNNERRGIFSDPFCLLLAPFSSYWVASSSFDMMVYAYKYCSILCCNWLISLGGLHFPEGNQRLNGSGKEGR